MSHPVLTRTTLLCALAIACVSCGSDKKKTTAPVVLPGLPNTSITNVIANLRTAYVTKDSTLYAMLLAPSFEFHFAPEDVGQNGIPAAWGLADELSSASNLFGGVANQDGYRAVQITLAFESGEGEENPEEFPTGTAVTLTSVFLTVEGRHATTSDLLYYQVEGDKERLYFIQTDEIDPRDGGRIWKIVRWDDVPIGGGLSATQNTTWGVIKALFKAG